MSDDGSSETAGEPDSLSGRLSARLHWVLDILRDFSWSRHLDPPSK